MTDRSVGGACTSRHPLTRPGFRRLFAATTTSAVGDSIAPLALTFAVLDLDASASTLGLVLMARLAPQIVFAIVVGSVGDGTSRHRLMALADAARSVIQMGTGA